MDDHLYNYPNRMNAVYFLVDDNANKQGDRAAIHYGESRITYSKLLEKVNRMGNGLKAIGISKGDRFICRLPNIPEAAISFLAGMKIGAIPIPSFHHLKEKELEYIVNSSDAKVIITIAEALKEVTNIKKRCKTLESIIVSGQAETDYVSFENLLKEGSLYLEPADTTKDDLAFLCYTSGTTGTPKALPHKHENILFQTDTIVNFTLKLTDRDVLYTPAPFGFSFGLLSLIFIPFRFGCSSVFVRERLEPEKVFQLIEKHGVTVIKTNASHIARLLEVKNAEKKYNLSTLRAVTCGTSATPNYLFEEFERRFGIRLQLGYGMQEIIGGSHACPLGQGRPNTMGKTMEGWEAKIIDKGGKEVPIGEPGTLFLKGRSIIPYYWKDPERTRGYLVNGWLKTDDIVYQDSEGYFHFVSRSDDLIISSGWTIAPREIEEVMLEHPAVSEVVVIGIPDKVKGNIPVGTVVLNSGYEPGGKLEEEIRSFVKGRLAPFKYPRRIKFVQAIPKTVTGKGDRNKIKEIWATEG